MAAVLHPPLCVYLDLLNVVDDEHVLQVLHGSFHPVVERCCSLGVLQVKLIYGLQLLLCPLRVRKQGNVRKNKVVLIDVNEVFFGLDLHILV